MTDKRHFARIRFHQPVEFSHAGQLVPTNLLDISLRGALLERRGDAGLKLGDACRLRVELNAEQIIEMDGVVAHLTPEQVGLKCTNIELDSVTALRRLVEMNLGDEALIQREFQALLHSQP